MRPTPSLQSCIPDEGSELNILPEDEACKSHDYVIKKYRRCDTGEEEKELVSLSLVRTQRGADLLRSSRTRRVG